MIFCALSIFTLNFVALEALDALAKTQSPTAYFDVSLERVEQLFADLSIADFSNLRVRKVNKTRALFGTMNVYIDLGNEIATETKIYEKQGGEYRLMPYRVPLDKFCNFLGNDKYFYPDLVKGSDFPADIIAECPLKAKNYTINATVVNIL